MKVYIPSGLLSFSREFSSYKTPDQRTQGWNEQPHETRGEGDHLDTVGSLMLWRYLAGSGLPVTYHLTAGEGDEADVQVSHNGDPVYVNVKTSKYDEWEGDPEDNNYHVAVKQVELEKKLPDIYAQIFVHLEGEDGPHVHLCGWIDTSSQEFEDEPKDQNIPGTPDSQRGMWIDRGTLNGLELLIPNLEG